MIATDSDNWGGSRQQIVGLANLLQASFIRPGSVLI